MDTSDDILAERGAPRTLTVLATLMGVALLFSWLVAYALFDALVAAEMIARTSGSADPRPRWLLGVFAGFMGVFGVAAVFFRTLSRRQLARIDQMDEGETTDEHG